MILADKIITLRKKNGWSQEDLAEKINVSRQAVSKWEGAQTIPDLDKILQLSKVFGVSTDYLVKDEIEMEEYTEMDPEESERKIHKVTMEEANRFLDISKSNAIKIAIGVFLCIVSPITLLLLGGASDCGVISMGENQAGGIGLVVLIGIVAVAVGLFLTAGMKTKEFEYLEKEVIETEYGVTGMVKERKAQYRDTYATANIVGTILCILSVIPIFAGIIISESDFLMVCAVCALLFLVAIACILFVNVGCTEGAMEKLLQEGDYTKDNKQASKKLEVIDGLYWSIILALYLGSSFITMRWDVTWIIWPIAGILYGAVRAIVILTHKD